VPVKYATCLLALALAGCNTTKGAILVGHPPKADVVAVTEAKPVAGADILTPQGNARYNSAVSAWGNRIASAGLRLCRFFKAGGMDVECQ
jgi:hypothetical protein